MALFEEIYIAYQKDLYRFLLKLTNYDFSLSEELLAETFFQAFLSFERFKGQCEIKTWLCQIAKNTYSAYVRTEIRNRRLNDKLKDAADQADLLQKVEDRDLLRCIHTILKDCDRRAAEIVQYRMYAGLKFREIAKILNIKETTAKVIFYRTKTLIQIQLKERFDYEI